MRSSRMTGVLESSDSSKPFSTARTMRRQVGARVDQPQRRFQGERVRALLDDAGALAVVLADDDERTALHAGRGEVGERVGGDVGADDRLPGDGAAQGIVDGGAEHGGGGGLVGAGLEMDAEVAEQALRLHQHVEQVAHRRALVAADIGDARLQQRLGDGEDAFAVEGLAGAEPQALDLLVERDFSHVRPARHWPARDGRRGRQPSSRHDLAQDAQQAGLVARADDAVEVAVVARGAFGQALEYGFALRASASGDSCAGRSARRWRSIRPRRLRSRSGGRERGLVAAGGAARAPSG